MDENNLVNIIRKNEDKPLISLVRLAEKFENQPYAVKVAEIIGGVGLSLGTLVSCSGTVIPEPPPGPVEELYYNVPYVAQPAGSQLCGVASSIMVLNYYDENLSMDTFGPTITTNGQLDMSKLHSYVINNGYTFDAFEISKYQSQGIDEVIDVLERGPVMVWQKYSLTDDSKHHRVLIGYNNNKEEFTSHDPSRGKNFKIKYGEFFDLSFNQRCYFFEIRPENKVKSNTNNYQEQAIKIVNSQMDSILGKPEF